MMKKAMTRLTLVKVMAVKCGRTARMKHVTTLGLVVLFVAACTVQPTSAPTAIPTSPYVALQDSPIRGLSPQEIKDLETGAGAGFARAAELNGYPGPRHILELQKELGLSDEQRAQVQALYDGMNAEALAFGAEILQLEAELELAFRGKTIDEASLEGKVKALAEKYGDLRLVHLRTHLKAIQLLTPHQLVVYDQLRGYSQPQPTDHNQHP